MPLTEEQKQRAKSFFQKKEGKTMTVGDYLQRSQGDSMMFNSPTVDESLFERVRGRLKQRGQEIGSTFVEAARGEINPLETAVRTVGDVIGGLGDVVGEAAAPVIQPVVEKIAETEIGAKAFSALSEGIDRFQEWKSESEANRRIGEMIEGLGNIASIVPVTRAGEFGLSQAVRAGSAGIRAGERVAESAQSLVRGVRTTAKTAKDVVSDIAAKGKEFVERIPERSAIRRAERLSEDAFIQNLPDSVRPAAQKALTEAIPQRDISLLIDATPKEKMAFKDIMDQAREFHGNRRAKDPTLLVGETMRQPFKTLEQFIQKEGEELGEMAKQIPRETVPDVQDRVLKRLQETPGLEGLKIVDGELDFGDTVLSGPKSKIERKSIMEEFKDLSQKDAYQLHRKRQELFEQLGGRRQANLKLTATEEKALQSIREELANILDDLSPTYKELNAQYAPMANAKLRINKFFKDVAGADEDIIDMKAGLLARRLTGNAQSNPELRQMIRDVQKELKKRGVEVDVDVETMQEFFNMLNRYYDLARDTSFAGQTALGIDLAQRKGFTDRVLEETIGRLGSSEITRQKAFEELVESLLAE